MSDEQQLEDTREADADGATASAGQSSQADGGTDDPARRWTLRLLGLTALILAVYLIADRLTPFTSQARVHAMVVPVASEVSGSVTRVSVTSNQPVRAGDVLFTIDSDQYAIALEGAEASLEAARQSSGAAAAAVQAAQAGVETAQANLDYSRQELQRFLRIKTEDPGALSDRRLDSAEVAVVVAEQQLIAARAQLEQARQNLGQDGDRNSMVQQAMAALAQAQLNLKNTTVIAPTDGVVTDVRVDVGNFAAAGQPQMTFISTENVWVQADFTENNLGHVDIADTAGVIFDVFPGRVFSGEVQQMGFGVAVDSAPLGSLPTIQNNREWLRSAQRFPVLVDFSMDAEDQHRLRVGAQASVLIYSGDSVILNLLGSIYLRAASLLSYAY